MNTDEVLPTSPIAFDPRPPYFVEKQSLAAGLGDHYLQPALELRRRRLDDTHSLGIAALPVGPFGIRGSAKLDDASIRVV